MTVNKSQGQSLHRVGIFCSRDFFSHGQFYVAASRVGRSSSIRILAQDEQTKKKRRFLSNVVYEEVLTRWTYVHLKHLQLHFLKEVRCTMCEVIQLLYSNECTRDQYPFNGQMHTGTALVYTITKLRIHISISLHHLIVSIMHNNVRLYR